MTPVAVQAFASQALPAGARAAALGVPFEALALHHFPDGELMPVAPHPAATVIVYCTLDQPNDKLVALLLAADAWRRQGVERLVLVAPYLCYMRQDMVFAPGQPLSRDVVGGLLGAAFDRLVTVDAHLHRTRNLSQAFGGIRTDDVSAAEPLAEALAGPERPVVVGPDAESEPWVRRIAERVGGEVLLFRKTRRGDDKVWLHAPDLSSVRGRPVILVDDICSSGATLTVSAGLLRAARAASIDAGVVHALFDNDTLARLKAAGIGRVVSSDAVAHPTNQAHLAKVLAKVLRDEVKA